MFSIAFKLQALVYDITLPTTASLDYAIGLEKLSANGQFFVAAQMAVCNRQLKSCQTFVFLTAHVAYASANKTKII